MTMTYPRMQQSSPRQPVMPERNNVSGTPRGMHLITSPPKWREENNGVNVDDDDVSVLTFNTFVTSVNNATLNLKTPQPTHHVQPERTKSIVESARETFEKKLSSPETKRGDERNVAVGLSTKFHVEKNGVQSPKEYSYIKGSLSRLSEEERSDSQVSSSCPTKVSGTDPIFDASEGTKRNEKDINDGEKDERGDGDEFNDDDTLSLAQSVLDNASEILTKVRRNKTLSSPSTEREKDKDDRVDNGIQTGSNVYNLRRNFYSPNKAPYNASFGGDDDEKHSRSNLLSAKKDFHSQTKNANIKDHPKKYNNIFLRSPNNENFNNINYNTGNNNKNNTTSYAKSVKLQTLESETKHLQQILKERQAETKKASKVLDLSIEKANELLLRVSTERRARKLN